MLLWSFEGVREPRAFTISAVLPAGKHLFPFRTEKLSLPGPMVLGEQSPGRVGRRRLFSYEREPRKRLPFMVQDASTCARLRARARTTPGGVPPARTPGRGRRRRCSPT